MASQESSERGLPRPSSPSDIQKGQPSTSQPESPSSTSDEQALQRTDKTKSFVRQPSILASIMLGEPKDLMSKQEVIKSCRDQGLERQSESDQNKSAKATMRALLTGQYTSEHLYSKEQLQQMVKNKTAGSNNNSTAELLQQQKKLQTNQRIKQQIQVHKLQQQQQWQRQKQQQQQQQQQHHLSPQRSQEPLSPHNSAKRYTPKLTAMLPPADPVKMSTRVNSTPPPEPQVPATPPMSQSAPMSAFLHPSYDSMLMSAQARLNYNNTTAQMPALPIQEATVACLIKDNNREQSKGSIKSSSYSGMSRSLNRTSAIPTDGSPAKRRCMSLISQQHHSSMDQDQEQFGGSVCRETTLHLRQKRFLKTREALEKSGLLGITMRTASLINENKALDKQIEQLKQDTEVLMKSVVTQQQNEQHRQLQQQHQSHLLVKYANILMNEMGTY